MERQTIELLRFALAAIWTECEKDAPSIDDIQQIADEALEKTKQWASKSKTLSVETGLESWHQKLVKVNKNNVKME